MNFISTLRSKPGLSFLIVEAIAAFSLTNIIAANYFIFLFDSGLNAQQALFLTASFQVAIFVMELPTGIVADIWGKKISTLSGYLMWIVGSLAYFAGSVWGLGLAAFLIAEIICATAFTLISGTFDSWIIEKLGEEKAEEILSKKHGLTKIVSSIAIVSGGFIAFQFGLAYMFVAEAIFAGIALIVGYVILSADTVKNHQKSGLELLTDSFGQILTNFTNNANARFVTVYTMISWFLIASVFAFWQPLSHTLGADDIERGFIMAGASFIMGLGALVWSYKYLSRLHQHTAFALTSFLQGIGLVALSFFEINLIILLIAFYLFELGFGMFLPKTAALFNQNIQGEIRAGLNSLHSLLNKLALAAGYIFFGFIVQNTSQATTWTISGAGFVILGVVYSALQYKNKAAKE